MKLKMIEGGYESFTGMFGTIEFKDGVSVRDVTPLEARQTAAIIGVEPVGANTDLSASAEFMAAKDIPASVDTLPTVAELVAQGKMEDPDAKKGEEKTAEPEFVEWKESDLEAIADKGGISALRKIAEPMGVRGNSIMKIISGIMDTQRVGKSQVVALAEGQPDVVTTEAAE